MLGSFDLVEVEGVGRVREGALELCPADPLGEEVGWHLDAFDVLEDALALLDSLLEDAIAALSAYNPLNEHERNPNALGASGPCQRRWRTEY